MPFFVPRSRINLTNVLWVLASGLPVGLLLGIQLTLAAKRARTSTSFISATPRALLKRMVTADEMQPRGHVDTKALACQGTLEEVLAFLEQRGCDWTQLAGSPRGALFKAFEPARSYFAICDSKQGYDYRSGDSYLTWDYWVIIRIDRRTYGCESDRFEVLD